MIEINNLTVDAVDGKFLAKVAKIVLKGENEKTKDISVVLVERKKIRELNKKYRKKDGSTDVLSFNYGNSGEIVLCLQEIKKNAAKMELPRVYGHGVSPSGRVLSAASPPKTKIAFKKEIARILIHGTLHLCGYDHEKSEKEAKKMRQKENSYIIKFFK